MELIHCSDYCHIFTDSRKPGKFHGVLTWLLAKYIIMLHKSFAKKVVAQRTHYENNMAVWQYVIVFWLIKIKHLCNIFSNFHVISALLCKCNARKVPPMYWSALDLPTHRKPAPPIIGQSAMAEVQWLNRYRVDYCVVYTNNVTGIRRGVGGVVVQTTFTNFPNKNYRRLAAKHSLVQVHFEVKKLTHFICLSN